MKNKKPTMFEAAKRVMGLMEELTARQIIVRLKDNGRKEAYGTREQHSNRADATEAEEVFSGWKR